MKCACNVNPCRSCETQMLVDLHSMANMKLLIFFLHPLYLHQHSHRFTRPEVLFVKPKCSMTSIPLPGRLAVEAAAADAERSGQESQPGHHLAPALGKGTQVLGLLLLLLFLLLFLLFLFWTHETTFIRSFRVISWMKQLAFPWGFCH